LDLSECEAMGTALMDHVKELGLIEEIHHQNKTSLTTESNKDN
jgi:hypothetical protein